MGEKKTKDKRQKRVTGCGKKHHWSLVTDPLSKEKKKSDRSKEIGAECSQLPTIIQRGRLTE